MTSTFDIVSFTKKYPLTKLSDYDNNIFIQKIEKIFTPQEQEFVMLSLYGHLNYDSEKQFVVKLDKASEMLGYSKIDKCKDLLISYYKENIDYAYEKNIDKYTLIGFIPGGGKPNIDKNTDSINPSTQGILNSGNNNKTKLETRGRPKEWIYLTIDCFKGLCLKANTIKSSEIHNYYIKLEKIFNEILIESSHNLRKLLTQQQDQLKLKDNDLERELINNFKNKQVLYLIFVTAVIIKFGHTNDIIERLRKHRKRFGDNIKLISIFETKYNREFELIIKKDPVLIKHIIPLENNIYKSVELIQLDSNFTMQHLTKRMDKLKENLKGDLIDNLINENYELKLQLAKYEPESLQQQKLELETKKYELRKEELNCMLTTTSPTIHKDQFRYQIYDPVSLEKIDRAAYKSIGDVCDEKKMFRDAREQSVGAAVKSCKVYKTYRFWRISQTDPDIQYTIPPTVELSKAPKYEQIVKLNSEGNEILGIYSCSEDAANKNKKQNYTTEEFRKFKKSITNNLRVRNALAYGYRWKYISDVDQNMLELYLQDHELPEVVINKGQIPIHKFKENGDFVLTYSSFTKAKKAEHKNDADFKDIIDNKILLNGYYFRKTREIFTNEEDEDNEEDAEEEEDSGEEEDE